MPVKRKGIGARLEQFSSWATATQTRHTRKLEPRASENGGA